MLCRYSRAHPYFDDVPVVVVVEAPAPLVWDACLAPLEAYRLKVVKDRLLHEMRHRDWGMAQLFEILDEDGDGELDCDEIGDALRRCGVPLRDLELEELFETLDADESGTVDESEFFDWLYGRGDAWLAAKRRSDDDDPFNDRRLLRRDAVRFEDATRRRLHAFWLLVDRDGDGAIDRDEYLDLHVHLYAAMHFGGAEPPDLAEARRVAEREWDFDSQGRDGLDHDLFNLSFFQLVDAWRAAAGDAAASFADYCSFLLDRVAVVVDDDPRHVDLRWRHDPDGWLGDLPRFRSLRKAIASAVQKADAMLGVLGLADPVDGGDASDGDTAALVEDAEEPAAAAAPAPTPAVFDDSVLSGARSAKVLDDARPAIFDDSLASLVPSLMQSLVDPFAGDDRLPPCLDSLVFAGDDAEAGDDATAAPAEADPEGDAPGDAAASTPSPAAEPATPSPESPESEAPGDAAAASTALPAAEPEPPSPGRSVGRGAVARGAVAAGVRDAVGDAVAVGPPSRRRRADRPPRRRATPRRPPRLRPTRRPRRGPRTRRRCSPPRCRPRVVARPPRRVPTDESESPAATLLLSPASTFLRTLGHPDDDTTAPGDGASDGGPAAAPGTEEPSADSAELRGLVRLERSRALHHFDDPALHHDHARAALRDEEARREAAARQRAAGAADDHACRVRRRRALVPQARADTPEDSLSTAPDFASETASSATPPPAATDDSDDGGDDAPPARRPSRQLPTFRGHAIFAARDQGRPVVPAAARREPPAPVWHSPRQVPANGPAVPKLLETEDVVLPRNLTTLGFRAGCPSTRRQRRAAAAVEPAILRLRELPWAARIGRPADPPKRPRDIFGRLRLPAPVVDASAESEATPRDPRVDQILKEQDRYAYVLRTYIKYL
ncbi:serine/threonine kinase [Aureococcus anophagefferens]|nr:serine/threonine kinase [Aureococcus anophagefferens]